jgi:hypothetical protein
VKHIILVFPKKLIKKITHSRCNCLSDDFSTKE